MGDRKEFLRIRVESPTASFRDPTFIQGYQPSLPIPPVSTVLGFLSSCSGSRLPLQGLLLGYRFRNETTMVNLESGPELAKNFKDYKMNILKRELLCWCSLEIFLSDLSMESFARVPVRPLCLGRTEDIARIASIDRIAGHRIGEGIVHGTWLPDNTLGSSGHVHRVSFLFDEKYIRKITLAKRCFAQVDPARISDGSHLWHLDCDPEDEAVYFHDFAGQA